MTSSIFFAVLPDFIFKLINATLKKFNFSKKVQICGILQNNKMYQFPNGSTGIAMKLSRLNSGSYYENYCQIFCTLTSFGLPLESATNRIIIKILQRPRENAVKNVNWRFKINLQVNQHASFVKYKKVWKEKFREMLKKEPRN